jgi:hypothetical protein
MVILPVPGKAQILIAEIAGLSEVKLLVGRRRRDASLGFGRRGRRPSA